MTPTARFTVLAMLAALGVVLAATVIGVVTYWPEDRTIEPAPSLARQTTEEAEVVALTRRPCRVPGSTGCSRVTVELTSGENEGERGSFTFGDTSSDVRLELGDRVRVYDTGLPQDATVGGVAVDRYGFADFERRSPLLWLAAGFAILVLLTGRLQGLRALLGLAGSLLVIVFFVVPAILGGRSPAPVALFGALAVMFVTIPLTHGLGAKSLAACLGTATSLLLTLALADLFIDLTHLTGLASEETTFLRALEGDVSIQGLLLAGMVIGAWACWTTSPSARHPRSWRSGAPTPPSSTGSCSRAPSESATITSPRP